MASERLIKMASIILYFTKNESLLERGENSYTSGHVVKLDFDVSLRIVRGVVKSSMKTKQYQVEIYFTDEFRIEMAKCQCPRGQLICHHMGAVLFAAHYDISKTDTGCTWNPKPMDIADVVNCQELWKIDKPPRVTNRDLNQAEISKLFEKLKLQPPCGFLWLLRDEPVVPDSFGLVDIQSILLSQEYAVAPNQTEFLRNKMKLTPQDIQRIAELTKDQILCASWYEARRNRITASICGRVLASINRNRFPPSLFKLIYDQPNLDGVKAVEWGRTHEKDGIACLEEYLSDSVRRTGIWLNLTGVVGASPDGFVGTECVVEIKCPSKYRQVLITQALSVDKSYIIYYESQDWHVNQSHEYYHQIQAQMHLCDKKFCWLVVWTPLEVAILIVPRDEKWTDNLVKLENFFFNQYVPFLLRN